MDSGTTSSERTPNEEGLPKVAAVKMAVREGGKRMMDKIHPSFVELVKDSPSLKGEASNATYHIMEAHNLTLEEISCLLFAGAFLDQKRLQELQSQVEKAKETERTLREEKIRAKEDLNVAQKEIDRVRYEAEQEKQKLQDAHRELIKEYDEFRKKSVNNDQVRQLAEKCASLEEDNMRLRRERSDLSGRLSAMEREMYSTEAALKSRIRTLEQMVHNFQTTMQGVYRQIAPYRYQLPNRTPKYLQQVGRPHSDPSIAVVSEGNSRFYANSRRPAHNPGPTSREATTDLMARRGQGVEPLPDGPWRHQPRLRPPDEQVVGTFPRIPITTFTPLQSPPLASSNSHVSSTSKFSQSTQSDAFMSTVERSNQQSLVYQDMREGSIPLAGDQAQSDGRVTPSVCPLCGVTIMGDIFNAVSHMAECRITAAN